MNSFTQTPIVYVTGFLDGCIINCGVVKSLFISDHSITTQYYKHILGETSSECSINTCWINSCSLIDLTNVH